MYVYIYRAIASYLYIYIYIYNYTLVQQYCYINLSLSIVNHANHACNLVVSIRSIYSLCRIHNTIGNLSAVQLTAVT